MLRRLHRLRRFLAFARAHFELLFYLYLWAMAAVLAALAGRPALGLVGLGTVLPFAFAYAWRTGRRTDEEARRQDAESAKRPRD
ncbi:MAG: hypothetical protein HY908_11565 [Myxococcales bacterium]|nr:hypothetical protein [Myxococcales bacterium]